jgi:uridylate kinase
MDASAIAMMRDNAIPIIVFSIKGRGNLLSILNGDGKGVHTIITEDRHKR